MSNWRSGDERSSKGTSCSTLRTLASMIDEENEVCGVTQRICEVEVTGNEQTHYHLSVCLSNL